MAIEHGRNVLIYQGDSGTSPIIASAKSCTVGYKSDVIEKASSTSATAKEYITGRTEWEVSLNHLVTTGSGINPFEGLLMMGSTYTLRIVIASTVMKGTAICTQYEMNAAVGQLATGSVHLKGTGVLAPLT